MSTIPGPPAPPAPPWLVEVPLTHRGLHGPGVPENSLPAFEAAAAAGYGAELDVALSADGIPVVVHDTDLARVSDRTDRVADLTAAQLGKVRLEGTEAAVPTLAAALRALREVPVMVEVKSDAWRAGRLEPAVARVLDGHAGPVCVASFNPSSLRWFRRQRPDVLRVLTSGGLADAGLPGLMRRRLEALRDLDSVAPVAVSYALRDLPHPATDRWRQRGGALVTWTATDEAGLARARQLADNVIFEHVRP